jgi:hypothetical protein
MKIFKIFCLLITLAHIPLVHSDDMVNGNCEQSIKSIVAIGNQLKKNPQFQKEDLNAIVNGLTQNLKIREFLKTEVITRLTDPNPNLVNDFVSNKENIARCAASSN